MSLRVFFVGKVNIVRGYDFDVVFAGQLYQFRFYLFLQFIYIMVSARHSSFVAL